jgi:hypothetical protein
VRGAPSACPAPPRTGSASRARLWGKPAHGNKHLAQFNKNEPIDLKTELMVGRKRPILLIKERLYLLKTKILEICFTTGTGTFYYVQSFVADLYSSNPDPDY